MSLTNPAFFNKLRCREILGFDISKRLEISPAVKSLFFSKSRIFLRVGSASALNTALLFNCGHFFL